MKLARFLLLASSAFIQFLLPCFAQSRGGHGDIGSATQRDYPFKPVPFTAVHLHDAFWAPRIEINREVTIPFAFRQCELTGRVANFDHAAEALRGQLGDANVKLPGYPFDDTDIYKII